MDVVNRCLELLKLEGLGLSKVELGYSFRNSYASQTVTEQCSTLDFLWVYFFIPGMQSNIVSVEIIV